MSLLLSVQFSSYRVEPIDNKVVIVDDSSSNIHSYSP